MFIDFGLVYTAAYMRCAFIPYKHDGEFRFYGTTIDWRTPSKPGWLMRRDQADELRCL